MKRGHLVVVKSNLRDHCPPFLFRESMQSMSGILRTCGTTFSLRLTTTPSLPSPDLGWAVWTYKTNAAPLGLPSTLDVPGPLSGFTEQTWGWEEDCPSKKSNPLVRERILSTPQSGAGLIGFCWVHTPKTWVGMIVPQKG